MDLRVVRTQVQLCGDTAAAGIPTADQVDVLGIVGIKVSPMSMISWGALALATLSSLVAGLSPLASTPLAQW